MTATSLNNQEVFEGLDKCFNKCFNKRVARVGRLVKTGVLKNCLTRWNRFVNISLQRRRCGEEKINFRLLFPKQEKSNEEISLCENLTAMCEWAI